MQDRAIVERVKKDCDQLTVTNPAPEFDTDPDTMDRHIPCNWEVETIGLNKYILFKHDCTEYADWFGEENAKGRTLFDVVREKIAANLQLKSGLVGMTLETVDKSGKKELSAHISLADIKKRYNISEEVIAEDTKVQKKSAEKKEPSLFSRFCCLFTACCADENEAKGRNRVRDEHAGPSYIRMDRM